MMAGKTEWEGINVMLHPHDTIASKADSDVQRGKCNEAAAVSYYYIHMISERVSQPIFRPLYIPQNKKLIELY
jgi:hypothetical protein